MAELELVLTLLLLEYGFGAFDKFFEKINRGLVLTLLLLEYGFGATPMATVMGQTTSLNPSFTGIRFRGMVNLIKRFYSKRLNPSFTGIRFRGQSTE